MSTKGLSYEYGITGRNDDYVENLINENDFLKGMLSSFWTGDVPNSATLSHMILAKAGRFRIAEKAKVCSLLGGNA